MCWDGSFPKSVHSVCSLPPFFWKVILRTREKEFLDSFLTLLFPLPRKDHTYLTFAKVRILLTPSLSIAPRPYQGKHQCRLGRPHPLCERHSWLTPNGADAWEMVCCLVLQATHAAVARKEISPGQGPAERGGENVVSHHFLDGRTNIMFQNSAGNAARREPDQIKVHEITQPMELVLVLEAPSNANRIGIWALHLF